MSPGPSYSLRSASRSLFDFCLSLIRQLNSLFRFLGISMQAAVAVKIVIEAAQLRLDPILLHHYNDHLLEG